MGCGAGTQDRPSVQLAEFQSAYAHVIINDTDLVIIAKQFLSKVVTSRYNNTFAKEGLPQLVYEKVHNLDNCRVEVYKGDTAIIPTGNIISDVRKFNDIAEGVEFHLLLHVEDGLPEMFIISLPASSPPATEYTITQHNPSKPTAEPVAEAMSAASSETRVLTLPSSDIGVNPQRGRRHSALNAMIDMDQAYQKEQLDAATDEQSEVLSPKPKQRLSRSEPGSPQGPRGKPLSQLESQSEPVSPQAPMDAWTPHRQRRASVSELHSQLQAINAELLIYGKPLPLDAPQQNRRPKDESTAQSSPKMNRRHSMSALDAKHLVMETTMQRQRPATPDAKPVELQLLDERKLPAAHEGAVQKRQLRFSSSMGQLQPQDISPKRPACKQQASTPKTHAPLLVQKHVDAAVTA